MHLNELREYLMQSQKFTRSKAVQWLTRLAYPYGAVRKIRRGALKGHGVVVSPGMGATFIWGAQDWSWINREIKLGWTVYDIGANCGQSTLHIARAVGPHGCVVAFEPVPQNFATLKRNLELNGLQQVVPVCAAVSDREGVGAFSFNPDDPTGGRVEGSGNTEVTLIRLDNGRWPVPNLIKVDVEGGGPDVFAGAFEIIAKHRPVVYLEIHSSEEHLAGKNLMQTHGYTAEALGGRPVDDPTKDLANPLVLRPA